MSVSLANDGYVRSARRRAPAVHEACRRIIDEHSKSFALASRLLPGSCREDAVAMYAWCRRADDAIDRAGEGSLSAALVALRRELDGVYAGEIFDDPVLTGFQAVAYERRVPLLYPRELLDGMAMDVFPRSYETMEELLLYCHRVAGVVGLMMCHVMGIRSDEALPHAAHLGLAMQLTNICRDVKEDWERGRCYLPGEMLSARAREVLGGSATAGMPVEVREELKGVVRRLLALAEEYYRSGDAGLVYLEGRAAWAIRTARLVYSAIGGRVLRQGGDVMRGRAYVGKGSKLALVGRAWMESFFPERRDSRPARVPGGVLEYPRAVVL